MLARPGRKTFLLCVGAHKAGTTWIHRYLEQHEHVDLGFLKEYHFFDALTLPEGKMFFNRYIEFAQERLALIQRQLKQETQKLRPLKTSIFKMADFLVDYNNYFDYFANILHTRDDIAVTGDITPAYCSLSPDVFRVIKMGFADRGVRVKVLFLLRDPVERCISASQFNTGRWEKDRDFSTLRTSDFDKIVRKNYKTYGFEERARYDMTMRNLESVFDDDEVRYEFYETLFNTESIGRISEYLGIQRREVDTTERINESKVKFVLSEGLRAELFAHYAPVYDFIYRKFSRDFIDTIWTNATGREIAL